MTYKKDIYKQTVIENNLYNLYYLQYIIKKYEKKRKESRQELNVRMLMTFLLIEH